ncbi:tetratricopeptide repeat protein [candidate division KSB1 bacterium]|nr:tetratricopeptide repeat protein [candidate division KSB1 bacterium]
MQGSFMQSYASEIEWLRQKVSEEPASMLYARLADRYLKVSEIGQAIECAEKGVLLHPHDATQRFVLAKCYLERKEFEKADKHLKEALAADPNHIAALYLRSDILKNSGDIDQVRDNYSRIIDLDPFDDAIHQKIYDLQFEKADTLKDEWNLDLPLEKPEPAEADALLELPPTQEAGDEAKWIFETEESSPADRYLDDPFADLTKSTADLSASAESTYADQPGADATVSQQRDDDIPDESIDVDLEFDRSKFKEEERKFTKLLDNIFSANLEEEEQVEKDEGGAVMQKSGDSVADDEQTGIAPLDSKGDDDFEPLLDPEKIISPEEKIFWHDRDMRDRLFGTDDQLDEDEIAEEFAAPEEEMTDAHPHAKPNDFSEFLNSLDIQEEETEEKKTFAKPWSTAAAADESLPAASAAKERARTQDEKPSPPQADQTRGDREKQQDDRQKGKFITPTLGEIYAAQGQYAKAISVFETLIKNDPDNDWYQSKLDYLRKKLAEQNN